MKKLRLLITKECNRNCSGCCNKQWDLTKLPVCTDYSGYDEIMITGGEPMLMGTGVLRICQEIRRQNLKTKLIIYTTDLASFLWYCLDWVVDGITVTLHDNIDARLFIKTEKEYKADKEMSLRLNVFKGVKIPAKLRNNWVIKDNIEWIEDCPLPENEVFMRTQEAI